MNPALSSHPVYFGGGWCSYTLFQYSLPLCAIVLRINWKGRLNKEAQDSEINPLKVGFTKNLLDPELKEVH